MTLQTPETRAISPLRMRQRPPRSQSALLATLFGLLVPGGGQLYVCRPGKALLMLLGIGGLIAGGCALTGWTCVRPDTHRLEFLAHAFNLGPTAYLLHATEGMQVTEYMRWYEVGRQYVAIAGLLNIVAICDAWGHVIRHNRRAHSWQRILRLRAHNAVQREENERIRALLDAQAQHLEGTQPPPQLTPQPQDAEETLDRLLADEENPS